MKFTAFILTLILCLFLIGCQSDLPLYTYRDLSSLISTEKSEVISMLNEHEIYDPLQSEWNNLEYEEVDASTAKKIHEMINEVVAYYYNWNYARAKQEGNSPKFIESELQSQISDSRYFEQNKAFIEKYKINTIIYEGIIFPLNIAKISYDYPEVRYKVYAQINVNIFPLNSEYYIDYPNGQSNTIIDIWFYFSHEKDNTLEVIGWIEKSDFDNPMITKIFCADKVGVI